MTRLFAFDPERYASTYARQGFVHIPQGLSEAYHRLLCQQVDAHLQGELLHNFALGNKQQALYPLPEEHQAELFAGVAAVCGVDADQLVLSERHIKSYDPNADPSPLAHKDRLGSEVSVGFSVRVPAGSTLVLYPYDELAINPFSSSAELRASLRPELRPEKTLQGATRVEIADGPGDVVLFRGNAIWHLRARPAGTVMVYFKINTFNSDPLGEDPRSPAFHQRSQALATWPDDQLETMRPLLGRKVDYFHRRFNHQGQEVAGVVLGGEKHLTLEEAEFRALRMLAGGGTVKDVARAMGDDSSWQARLERVRFLAARGVIDLLPGKHEPEMSGTPSERERVPSPC